MYHEASNYDVSVVIPVYNVKKFLSRCLDSVQKQSLSNIQVICVNDGSTDGCAEILSDYAQKDQRIEIITQENQGLSAARNAGLEKVRGQYVFFLDADDYLHPQALEIFYRAAEQSGLPVVISRKLIRIGKDKIDMKKYHSCNVPYRICKHPLDDLYAHRLISAVVWNKLYRADVLKPFRFIKGIYYEDWPYTTCLFSTIDSFALIDERLYLYNTNSPSIVRSSFSVKKIKDYVTGIRCVYQYLTAQNNMKAWKIVRKKRVAASLKMVLSKISKSKMNQEELERCFVQEYNRLTHDKMTSFADLSLKSKFRLLRIFWHRRHDK